MMAPTTMKRTSFSSSSVTQALCSTASSRAPSSVPVTRLDGAAQPPRVDAAATGRAGGRAGPRAMSAGRAGGGVARPGHKPQQAGTYPGSDVPAAPDDLPVDKNL